MISAAHRLRLVALLLAVAVAAARPARAEETAVNRRVAVLLLLKILTYDKAFAARGSGDFVVLLACEPTQRPERDRLLEEIQTTGPRQILSRPLKFARAEVDAKALGDRITETGASAVLVLPGLSAASTTAVSQLGTERKIYTLGLEEAAIVRGVALGVSTAQGKPQIVINRPSTQAIGAAFENALLQRAKVIP